MKNFWTVHGTQRDPRPLHSHLSLFMNERPLSVRCLYGCVRRLYLSVYTLTVCDLSLAPVETPVRSPYTDFSPTCLQKSINVTK